VHIDAFRRIALKTGFLALLCGTAGIFPACRAEPEPTIRVAVAANFTQPAREIADLLHQATGSSAVMSSGSTGQLFTQITQDAPFDVFLAADQETPRRAAAEGFGLEDTIVTYAVGKVVLFSPGMDLSRGDAVLREARFERLAIANPATAPYGAAAIGAMKSLGVEEQLRGKLVQGNNIAQTFQFVESGNAEAGFVALSQVIGRDPKSIWMVPDTIYSPIRQDAILLRRSAQNSAARAFMAFLKSPEVLQVIQKYGYSGSP
jgi:molybdate transport system substrate-binding protein